MSVPVSQSPIFVPLFTQDLAIDPPAARCPRCDGTGWVKTFTPWGCPTNTPCPCTAVAVTHPRDQSLPK